VTDADFRQMQERGVPTTLGTKAMQALTRRPASSLRIGDCFGLVVDVEILVQIQDRDDTLASWFVDGRTGAAPIAPVVPIRMPEAVTQTAPIVHTVNDVPVGAFRMASVPDKSLAKRYIHRSLTGGIEDFTLFEHALANSQNILIKGPTGAAKTMSALAFAASKGKPTFTISGSVNFEASEAFGTTMLDPVNGMPYFQYGGAIEVIRDGGILILDEINFIPSKVITPLYPLLDQRREVVLKQNKGEVIKAHPDLLIIATMNPGYLGTASLNAAVVNRFNHHLDWGYDEGVEKTLVPSKAIREIAKQLRVQEAARQITTPTPTNALMDLVSNAKALGLDYALGNFLARYDESEQGAVRLALETHRANIESDLGIAPAPVIEQDEVAAQPTEFKWEDFIQPNIVNPPAAAIPSVATPTF
jgi:hypothetical protein